MTTKEQIDHINTQIKEFEQLREDIQNKCPHEKTEIVDYMWRVGSTMKASVCSDCYKFLKAEDSYDTIE